MPESTVKRTRATTSEHGTVSGWRTGCRCVLCRTAHNNRSREDRRDDRAEWWSTRIGPLCDLLASGTPYREALNEIGTSPSAVIGRRKVDAVFAARIDGALMEGRDPTLDHGTWTAWKARCRCPECREHHESYR